MLVAGGRRDLIMAKRMLRSEACPGQGMAFVKLFNLLCSSVEGESFVLCFVMIIG